MKRGMAQTLFSLQYTHMRKREKAGGKRKKKRPADNLEGLGMRVFV